MAGDAEKHTRGNRVARYVTVGLAVLVIAWAGWGAAHRMTELAQGHDISIVVPLTATQVDAMFRSDPSNSLALHITSITFPFAKPSTGMLGALWVDAIVRLLAIVAGAIVAARFLYRVARGLAFEHGTARLLLLGAGAILIAWATHSLVTAATAPAAFSQRVGKEVDIGAIAIDLTPVVWMLFLVAVGVAFRMGEKLRRETAGLV
jgi:hypothetical protein